MSCARVLQVQVVMVMGLLEVQVSLAVTISVSLPLAVSWQVRLSASHCLHTAHHDHNVIVLIA
jgi:hypothetical protein